MVAIGENEHSRSPESWTVPQTLRQTIAKTRESWARSQSIITPDRVAARPAGPGGRRIAFLVYRGNPQCGGQGVYTRHLTRELVRLGHSVEVFSGPPWPELDEGVGFTPVPGLDLYRDPDPFRWPAPREFHDLADVGEFAIMLSGPCWRRCTTPSRWTARLRSSTRPRPGSATPRGAGSASSACRCAWCADSARC